MANCQKLMDMTGDIPLGLYETPIPKARHLTPAMVRWIAESGRFTFLKDTSLEVSTLVEKIQAAKSVEGTPLKYVLPPETSDMRKSGHTQKSFSIWEVSSKNHLV